MSLPLFRMTLRTNWILILLFFLIMFIYLYIIILMYDPVDMEGIIAFLEMMPKDFMKAMGFDNLGTSFNSYLGNFYYDFIAIMFPLIYSIFLAYKLIAKEIEDRSIAYLLATPNSRLRIISTKALYLLVSLTIIKGSLTICGLILCSYLYPKEFDGRVFFLLNLTNTFVFYGVSGISFFFSCFLTPSKYTLSFSAGIPILLFTLKMLSNVSEKLGVIGSLSPFNFIRPEEVILGEPLLPGMAFSLLLALFMYGGGIYLFQRKDLPL